MWLMGLLILAFTILVGVSSPEVGQFLVAPGLILGLLFCLIGWGRARRRREREELVRLQLEELRRKERNG